MEYLPAGRQGFYRKEFYWGSSPLGRTKLKTRGKLICPPNLISKMSHTGGILAMKPIVLNGDLKKIK